jgi:hypothetical protein
VLLVLAGAVVLTMYRPTWHSLTSTLPWNLGDPALGTWTLAWEWHSLLNEPSQFFDGNLFHPYGEALKYSDLILPAMPFFGLLLTLSQSVIVAHNVTILALSLFCVIATYLLAMRLMGGLAGVVTAVAFSFSGYVFMHQSHLQLLTLGFFPLALLMLLRALESRRLRDGVLLGLSSGALALASFYYAAVWFVCLIVVVVVDAIRLRWPEREWWLGMGTAAGVTVLCVAPIAYVYASFQARIPFIREVGEFGLNPIDFLTPAPGSVLYSGLFNWAAARQPGGLVEHGFFLGFIVLALALAGSAAWVVQASRAIHHPAWRTRAHLEIGYVALAGLVSLLLAVGPEARGVPMPFALLDSLPGFSSIRAVSRFAVPALLAACVLGGWFLARVLVSVKPLLRFLLTLVISGAVLLELAVVPSRAAVEEPMEIREVLRESPQGAVVELPMLPGSGPPFVFVEGPRLLESIGDWRPRFNGFSGGFPPGYLDDIAELSEFPKQSAMDRIQELGLRYVVLHGSPDTEAGAYSFDEIEVLLENVPASASVTRSGDSWLIDLRSGTDDPPRDD